MIEHDDPHLSARLAAMATGMTAIAQAMQAAVAADDRDLYARLAARFQLIDGRLTWFINQTDPNRLSAAMQDVARRTKNDTISPKTED